VNDTDGKIFAVPIEQKQPGNVEAETRVFAKITIPVQDAATIPGVSPVTPAPMTPAPAAVTPPAPAPAATTAAQDRQSKSRTRRLARRILGPTLMTKK
jgi:hypothetical protein